MQFHIKNYLLIFKILASIFFGLLLCSKTSGQVVVGSGSAGGVVLISDGAGLLLNGNKVYDRLGNVKDVVIGTGVLTNKTINYSDNITSIKSGSHVDFIYSPDLGKNILPFVNFSINSMGLFHVEIKPGGYSFTNRVKVRFGGAIDSFSLSGGDVLEVEGGQFKSLSVNQSGSSVFVVRAMKVENIRITSSGSSSAIVITDQPVNINFKLSGGSNMLVGNAGNISGAISGGSTLVIGRKNGSSKVSVTGGGRLISSSF
jgi:hypothetical protein